MPPEEAFLSFIYKNTIAITAYRISMDKMILKVKITVEYSCIITVFCYE